jgi:outer membrane protein assembly factor BamB
MGIAGLRPLILVMGVVVAAAPIFGADKPPAATPTWSATTKFDMQRICVGMDGSVVYARDGKKLTGLGTADGSQKWQIELPGFEEKGYWGQVEDTTYLYCTGKEMVGIDVETGKERWRKSPGDGIETDAWIKPRVGNPKAMLFAFEDGVSVWDIAPGKLLWSAKEPLSEDLVPNSWADDADPESGVLIFLGKRTVLVGPNGKELWSAAEKGNERRGGKDILMSAVFGYGRLLVVFLSKSVVLLNSVTGEVLASQTFPSTEAAADVEAMLLDERGIEAVGQEKPNPPLAVALGGRLVIADPKEGKVLARTPENSILGQVAEGFVKGGDVVALTAVRGGEKTPNVGLHLYRVNPATGEVKWHAQNKQQLDSRQVMSHIVGERINGPYLLEKAKGVLLATSDTGVRLYDWEDGKERWAADEGLPNSYRVMSYFGNNSFAVIRSMMQNRVYVPTNPAPVEGDGVVYVAGSDNVFALDATTGKVKWESKSKSLGLVSGLAADGGTVIVRQGLYADSNDYGAPTRVTWQFLGPVFVEEPEVYIEEDPYGFVGLDAATGKESWNCLDFESHDAAMLGEMPKDASICQVAKANKEKGCRLSKLGVGSIVYSYPTPKSIIYVGKGGMAGAPAGSCAASWSVDGSLKKLAPIYEVSPAGEEKGSGFVQHDDPPYLVTHYGKDVNVIDVASGKILVTAEKADAVKVQWSKKMLFVADGNDVAMYKLP